MRVGLSRQRWLIIVPWLPLHEMYDCAQASAVIHALDSNTATAIAFVMSPLPSKRLHLSELQLDRRGTAEDFDCDLQHAATVVHFLD